MVMIMSVYDQLFCRLELDFVMQETRSANAAARAANLCIREK
jgi:hypothetical protein